MKNLCLFFFAVLSHASLAQNISNTRLRWTVAGLEDVDNAATVSSYSCTFETNGTNAAYWKQKNGTYSTKLTVKRIEGTWNNVASEGKATFYIMADGQDGNLVFEKVGNATNAILTLSQADGTTNVYKFKVTLIAPF